MSTNANAAAVLDALGEPSRRRVLELLRDGPRAVGQIATEMPVSRPAVSQHLKVLRDAGLVTEHRDGTRHLYSVEPGGMAALREYLETYWQTALDRFKETAVKEPAKGGRQ